MKPKLAATVYGQKVDIYSYGVILWELATREWPYAELKFDFEVSILNYLLMYMKTGFHPGVCDAPGDAYI